MDSERKTFVETVAEKLIDQLRAGTAPWQRPWEPGQAGANLPINPTTGKRYKGINALQLMSAGREDQRWMTYRQAAAVDAQVRRGEKGTPIQYWKFTEEQARTDEAGKPLLDARGKPLKVLVNLERPRVFFATVFNAEQIDGLPPLQRKEQTWDAVDRAETILKASGAVIQHGEHDRAFYRPSTDSIHLPNKSQFPTADNYYATALHELGHWTGHKSRLDRDLAHPFGSEGYAKEELRAEVASMILGDEIGIGHDPKQHAAYVGSWIKALRDDPLVIFRAAAEAEKILDYVLGLEKELVLVGSAQHGLQAAERTEQPLDRPQTDAMEVGMDMLRNNEEDKDIVAQRVETWTLARIEKNALPRAIDQASIAQIDRVRYVLTAMEPLNDENPFWKRHKLPVDREALQDRIGAASGMADQRLADAAITATRLDLVTGHAKAEGTIRNADSFAAQSEATLGFPLPLDWNGRVRVGGYGTEAMDGQKVLTTILPKGTEPEAWGVFVQHTDGGFAMLTSFPTQHKADEMAERLALIDAHSTPNEFEKAAKLARINEERVRRDPNSTDEDISAAQELRKHAEIVATTNDEDLQRRVAFEELEQVQQASNAAAADKLFINVPFKQKEEAKALGAKWDRNEQSWYVPSGQDTAPFAKWIREGADAAASDTHAIAGDNQTSKAVEGRQYLAVPYSARVEARAAGAMWDKTAKSWYAGVDADMSRLGKWKPEIVSVPQDPAMTPREEFAEALVSVGCVISGEHPIMDGAKHRISVEGEKFTKNSGSGFYVGHLDGHPAGYVKNNKTGAELTWKAKGYTLPPEQKALLVAEAAGKLQQREAELSKLQDQAAKRVVKQLAKLLPIDRPTPYMLAKGIEPQEGAFTDQEGKKTYLPATDAEGKQWTMQYIHDDGTKRFAKDSRKEGCFHVVGRMPELAKAPALVICEGYATAVSLKQSLGYATVSAFDSGNLAIVAQALHKKFPDKPVVIAGDDDRHLEIVQGVNPGRTKSEEAAKLVGGKVLLPIFAPGENSFPTDIEQVTPALYREHQKTGSALSSEQLAVLARMKQFTDFNDLATKSALGKDGVDRQVRSFVDDAVEKHSLAQAERQQQERSQTQTSEAVPAEKPRRRHAAKLR